MVYLSGIRSAYMDLRLTNPHTIHTFYIYRLYSSSFSSGDLAAVSSDLAVSLEFSAADSVPWQPGRRGPWTRRADSPRWRRPCWRRRACAAPPAASRSASSGVSVWCGGRVSSDHWSSIAKQSGLTPLDAVVCFRASPTDQHIRRGQDLCRHG